MTKIEMSPIKFLVDGEFDLDEMTLNELEDLNAKLTVARNHIASVKNNVVKVLKVKQTEEQIRKELEEMDPLKKKVMTQILSGVGNIESEEEVH